MANDFFLGYFMFICCCLNNFKILDTFLMVLQNGNAFLIQLEYSHHTRLEDLWRTSGTPDMLHLCFLFFILFML